MPKEAVYLTIFMQGGETSSLPHSITEESEIMRDDNVFYSVMFECKLAQGIQKAFV